MSENSNPDWSIFIMDEQTIKYRIRVLAAHADIVHRGTNTVDTPPYNRFAEYLFGKALNDLIAERMKN